MKTYYVRVELCFTVEEETPKKAELKVEKLLDYIQTAQCKPELDTWRYNNITDITD